MQGGMTEFGNHGLPLQVPPLIPSLRRREGPVFGGNEAGVEGNRNLGARACTIHGLLDLDL